MRNRMLLFSDAQGLIEFASLRTRLHRSGINGIRPGTVEQAREHKSRESPPDKSQWPRAAAHDTRESTPELWSEPLMQA